MTKLHIRVVIEILGKPKENVSEALNLLLEKMGKEKGVKIIEKKVHEPVEIQEQKDLFTSFAEVEMELDSIYNYVGIIFAYMPSHIELISPKTIELRNEELNELGNNLVARLHNYEAISKTLVFEREALVNKLREVAPHLFGMKQAPTEKIKKKGKAKKSGKIKVKKL